MIRTRTGRPSSFRAAPRTFLAGGVAMAALLFAGCATGAGTASPTPTSIESAPVVSSTPDPSASEALPSPVPTETSTVEAPYNGEVLVVTAEKVDGRLEVTAMIPGVSESNGTCTLQVLDGGPTVSVAGTAGNDVTYCGVMSVTPDPSNAEWRFAVRYESGSTRAQSAESSVESIS